MTNPVPPAETRLSFYNRLPVWLPAALAVTLTILFFLPSLPNGFVNWDDHEYVLENPWIRTINAENLRAIWTQARGANYHPLVFVTHLLEYRLWELWAPGYHAVNLALHALAVLALFGVARQMKLDRLTAFLAAMWFGFHPLRVESVAWIAERKDVLCAAFYLGALALYLAAGHRRSRTLWIAAFSAYLLALLSKPMAVTWPVAAALCDLYIRRQLTVRWWLEKVLLILPAVALAVVTMLIQRDAQGIQPHMASDWIANIASAFRTYVFYLWKTVWPVNLSVFYPRDTWNWPIPALVQIVLGLGVVTGLGIYTRKRRLDLLLFGLAWYAVTLLPVSGIIPIGFVFAADRYMYIPAAGPTLTAAAGIAYLGRKLRGRAFATLWPAVIIVTLTLGIMTWQRCKVWHDAETLWRDTVAGAPGHYTWRMLGMAQLEAGKAEEAESSFRMSIAYSETQYGRFYLAEALRHQGRATEALSWYRKFIEEQDWYPPALSGAGLALMDLEQPREALPYFVTCIDREPENSLHRAHAGWALMDMGHFDEAASLFEQAREIDPRNPVVNYNLGVLHMWQSENEIAENYYRDVLRVNPLHHYARVNLAVVLNRQGRSTEARALLEQALRHHPDDEIARAELDALLRRNLE